MKVLFYRDARSLNKVGNFTQRRSTPLIRLTVSNCNYHRRRSTYIRVDPVKDVVVIRRRHSGIWSSDSIIACTLRRLRINALSLLLTSFPSHHEFSSRQHLNLHVNQWISITMILLLFLLFDQPSVIVSPACGLACSLINDPLQCTFCLAIGETGQVEVAMGVIEKPGTPVEHMNEL